MLPRVHCVEGFYTQLPFILLLYCAIKLDLTLNKLFIDLFTIVLHHDTVIIVLFYVYIFILFMLSTIKSINFFLSYMYMQMLLDT